MFAYTTSKSSSLKISRRRFVQGLVAGGVIAGFDLWRWPALAMRSVVEPAVLTGSPFDLVVDENPVNFTGRSAVTDAIHGANPAPQRHMRPRGAVTISGTHRSH